MTNQDRRDDLSFRHMLDHARDIVELSRGRTREVLETDRLYQLAMARAVEVIGEAANRISAERRAIHPEIPWPSIIGMRNRLIHGYDALNLDIVWQTISESVPSLLLLLEPIVAEIDRRTSLSDS